MGFAEFIDKKFVGQEICVFLDEDAETITFEQHWIANKAFFKGIVESTDEGILTLIIENCGPIYINCNEIVAIWHPSFDYHKAVNTSITRRMIGAKHKDR